MTEIMDHKWDSNSTLSSTINATVQMIRYAHCLYSRHYKEDKNYFHIGLFLGNIC
jgi:hypothetical protein